METKQVVDEDTSRLVLVGLVCQAVFLVKINVSSAFHHPCRCLWASLFLPDIVILMSLSD